MIVDDSKDYLSILDLTLRDDFELCLLNSGGDCLERVTDFDPAIILMDVHMPGMMGTEVCHLLKSNSETQYIQILLMSALYTQPADSMDGYYKGCDDYLTKPFESEALYSKLQTSLNAYNQVITLKKELEQKHHAKTDFVHTLAGLSARLLQIKDLEHLADISYDVQAQLGFSSVMLFSSDSEDTYRGEPNELEAKLLKASLRKAECVHFNQRCLIHTDHVALVIRNMPTLDALARESKTLHATIILRCIEGRYQKLLIADAAAMPNDVSGAIAIDNLVASYGKIGQVSQVMSDCEHQNRVIIEHLHDDVEQILFSLALTEEQENALTQMVDKSLTEFDTLLDLYRQGNEDLQDSILLLQTILPAPEISFF